MITLNEDGTKVIVANEGEPNTQYTYDPKGSIGIIDISNSYSYTDLTIPDEVVIKNGADANVDIEPEYQLKAIKLS